MTIPDDVPAFLALVHRMRVLQVQRDQTPGCSLGFRHLVAHAESEVDTILTAAYLPDSEPTPLEDGAA